MFRELLIYCILPVLALAQNTLSDEANEYRQDLWPYMDDLEQWSSPNELSNLLYYYDPRLRRWASQLKFGKRANWASKVRFG
uniref:Secreted protein n=1 Tax=Elaeophora elaphi TaxID=1147741 RepID=A0A0R3RVK0_9BILA